MVLQAREEILAFRFIAGISKNDTRAKIKLAPGRWRRRGFMFDNMAMSQSFISLSHSANTCADNVPVRV